jgi:hypothetical protein
VPRALFGWLLLAVSAAAPAETPAGLAGLYEIRQMEMAGGLELQPNGHFRYALEYGAASERGEGDWTVSGNSVLLTSNPRPNAPDFELVKDEPAATGELYVVLEPPGFGDWTGRLDLLVTIAGMDDPVAMEADEDGRVPLEGMVATAVRPLVPIYGIAGHEIPLGEGGHRLMVRFHANDLGQALFDKEPLRIEDGNLLMRRFEAVIRFRPAGQ